ncbi:MAG: hypothetical protein MJ033_05560, partial [Victivallaceae bacterium]|nr:hypothetical protein [Victivallaceae bacterium]
ILPYKNGYLSTVCCDIAKIKKLPYAKPRVPERSEERMRESAGAPPKIDQSREAGRTLSWVRRRF